MKINFFNQTEEETKKYEVLINKILKKKSLYKTMNIIFVSDEEIKQMNNDYRNKDYITDVISFPNDDRELGDIFICVEQAKRQAKEYNHSLEREMGFLAVHGYLHVIGYDHETYEEEEVMFKLQKEILEEANLKRGE
ncbi:MAG: rRNA maturation RNase YbeY [bacterium]